MLMKFFKPRGKVRRPSDVLKMNTTFDISSSELESMIVIEKRDCIQLTCHTNYGNVKMFDIIYSSPGYFLFSLYRSTDKLDARKNFHLLSKILNVIHSEVCLSTRTCTMNAQNLESIVNSIIKNQHWLPIHFAARFGLDNFFKLPKYKSYIKDYLNAPSIPLLRSPIMLAVLSGDVDTMKAILHLNPKINQHDKRGNNVLHFAAICKSKIWSPVLKYTMSQTNAYRLLGRRNNKLVTPIHFICYSKNFENMVELLKIGLPVELLTIEPPYILRKQNDLSGRSNEHLDQNNDNLRVKKSISENLLGEMSVKVEDSTLDNSLEKTENDERRTVQFTDEMIADLKFEDMIFGGTPLHWCQFKRTLERLIEYEFNVDAFDLNNETALTKCIRDNRFKCLVILLNAGANPNLINKKGNTTLHEAVLNKDIAAVQACVCWDAKLDEKNKAGATARHIASNRGTTEDQMIVHILHCVGAARCDKKMKDCRPDCSFNGLTNGKKYSKWPSFDRELPYFPFLNQTIIEKKLQECATDQQKNVEGKTEKKESKKARMVCFDGGGTKGLISVQMLIEIEKCLKRPLNEYFEWMAGTSTGSLITAMLSLNIPLRNIKVIYYMLKDKIMIGPRPYDSGLLECLLQGILGENVKMGQIEKRIIITGTLADRTPCQLYLFRSYPSPSEILGLSKRSIEKLLFGKKEEVQTKSLVKMKSTNPHAVIIEISSILTAYQQQHSSASTRSSSKKSNINESFDATTTVNESGGLKLVKSSMNLRTSTGKANPVAFNLNSNTTLSEFTETPHNTVHLTDDHGSMRLKFYHIPNYLNQKLWLACRSSGAAPTFFRASGPFIDGGIISNNPVLDSLTDFINYNCALRQKGLEEHTKELDLVLSIGTGKPPVVPTEVIDIGKLYSLNFLEPYQSAMQAFNLAQEMVQMATQTDAHVVQRGQAWCNSMQVAYFRLNPPLSENLQLNEVEEVEIVNALWETKAYMYNQRSIIEILAKLLERHSVIPGS